MERRRGFEARRPPPAGGPVRRARQDETLQQPTALLEAASHRPDPNHAGPPGLVCRRRAAVLLHLAERGEGPAVQGPDALSAARRGRGRDAGYTAWRREASVDRA